MLHFWVIFLHWNQAEIWKNYSVVQLFHCLPLWKTVLFVSCKSLFTVYSNVFVVYPCGKKLQNKTNLWWTQILEKKIRVTHRGLNTYLLSWSSSRVFEGLASEMGSRSSEDSFSWVVNSDIFWMTNCAWIAS